MPRSWTRTDLDAIKKFEGLNKASITSQEAAHALNGFHPPLSQLRHFSFPAIIILQGAKTSEHRRRLHI
jgi:hypothetical protein